jgi:hypothetical protein
MQVSEKIVDDASSIVAPGHDRLPQDHPFIAPCCHFCGGKGVVVSYFPRRGYGRRDSLTNIRSFRHPGGPHDQ